MTTWTIKAVGKARGFDTRRVSDSGRVTVPTRYATLGNPLQLEGYSFEDNEVSATLSVLADPAPAPDEFDVPPAGTHWVTFGGPLTALGEPDSDRWTTGLGGARLILTDNTSLDSKVLTGCASSVDMAPGETRNACVAFAVPDTALWRQLEWGPASSETGVWRP